MLQTAFDFCLQTDRGKSALVNFAKDIFAAHLDREIRLMQLAIFQIDNPAVSLAEISIGKQREVLSGNTVR